MLWNWYTINTCFLSASWHVASNGAFAASCLGALLLVMAMEALGRLGKEFDAWVLRGFQAQAAAVSHHNSAVSPFPSSFAQTVVTTALPVKNDSSGGGDGDASGEGRDLLVIRGGAAAAAAAATEESKARRRMTATVMVFRASPLQQLIRSLLHAVSLGLAYIVMLLVMSYNGYIIICVIIGAGLGKFFCDWMTRPMVVDLGDAATGMEEAAVCC